jgi:hypothetical protein
VRCISLLSQPRNAQQGLRAVMPCLGCEIVPGTGEVARFPVETLGTHKDAWLGSNAFFACFPSLMPAAALKAAVPMTKARGFAGASLGSFLAFHLQRIVTELWAQLFGQVAGCIQAGVVMCVPCAHGTGSCYVCAVLQVP